MEWKLKLIEQWMSGGSASPTTTAKSNSILSSRMEELIWFAWLRAERPKRMNEKKLNFNLISLVSFLAENKAGSSIDLSLGWLWAAASRTATSPKRKRASCTNSINSLSQLNNSSFLGCGWKSQRKVRVGWRVGWLMGLSELNWWSECWVCLFFVDYGLGSQPMLRKEKRTKPNNTHKSINEWSQEQPSFQSTQPTLIDLLFFLLSCLIEMEWIKQQSKKSELLCWIDFIHFFIFSFLWVMSGAPLPQKNPFHSFSTKEFHLSSLPSVN